jgi:hypothetical protein
MNATALPDGTVLVTGGSSAPNNDARQAVLAAELWNPATEQWTPMASMRVARMYHSTALLLPNGRVLSAGGGRPPAQAAGNYSNCEIYSPPYLFRGPRPRIFAAPTRVRYGQRFQIDTSTPSQIAQVSVVKLSSVTHCNNMDQRFRRLDWAAPRSGQVSVRVPSNPNLLPPGYYMLFFLNRAGVPSVAKFIRVG